MNFSLTDTVAVYGDQRVAIQAMLDYDYLCSKPHSSVLCVINPSLATAESKQTYFFGTKEMSLPVYKSLQQALDTHRPTILINFASARSAYAVAEEALNHSAIEKMTIIAEGVPERQSRLLRELALEKGKIVIGPATVGGLIAGVVKIGNSAGTIENVAAMKLFVRGNVGIVSKSGGMLNELMTMVTRTTNGVCEAIAIGGDRFPITTLREQVERFASNEDIKLIVLLGEVGGRQEYEIAELVKNRTITKPIVAWVSGTGAREFSENMQFGHAGAMANATDETSESKLKALREAGVIVPENYAGLEAVVHQEAVKLGIGESAAEMKVPALPKPFEQLLARGEVRYTKQMASSISPKKSGEATYAGQDITEVARNHNLGYVLGLLWFKQEFPQPVTDLFELILKLTADHGPAVSGAHNTIVTARAGKNLVDSLVAGLITIGPRFGGAVNDAALYFKHAADAGQSAFDFVAEMKAKGQYIPGIGHKVKSKTNPDPRVALLQEASETSSEQHKYLEFARGVEQVTTRKKDSLILNVDGIIAAILLDVLSEYMTSEEVEALLRMEALNAFFVLGRSTGLIGHFIDQKRLDQPLYRHPEYDIQEL